MEPLSRDHSKPQEAACTQGTTATWVTSGQPHLTLQGAGSLWLRIAKRHGQVSLCHILCVLVSHPLCHRMLQLCDFLFESCLK